MVFLMTGLLRDSSLNQTANKEMVPEGVTGYLFIHHLSLVIRLQMDLFGDIEIVPVVIYCKCQHSTLWLGMIYSYKGLLLVSRIEQMSKTINY